VGSDDGDDDDAAAGDGLLLMLLLLMLLLGMEMGREMMRQLLNVNDLCLAVHRN